MITDEWYNMIETCSNCSRVHFILSLIHDQQRSWQGLQWHLRIYLEYIFAEHEFAWPVMPPVIAFGEYSAALIIVAAALLPECNVTMKMSEYIQTAAAGGF
jgi:hypothetical protein